MWVWAQVVEYGLGFLPFTERCVVTPTGSSYMGVNFARKLCGVSIIRSGESMENALRACCQVRHQSPARPSHRLLGALLAAGPVGNAWHPTGTQQAQLTRACGSRSLGTHPPARVTHMAQTQITRRQPGQPFCAHQSPTSR